MLFHHSIPTKKIDKKPRRVDSSIVRLSMRGFARSFSSTWCRLNFGWSSCKAIICYLLKQMNRERCHASNLRSWLNDILLDQGARKVSIRTHCQFLVNQSGNFTLFSPLLIQSRVPKSTNLKKHFFPRGTKCKQFFPDIIVRISIHHFRTNKSRPRI